MDGPLALDRLAVLRGEVWRLWTGHWVHLGLDHLILDAVGVVVALLLLPVRPATVVLMPAIGACLLWLRPDLDGYCGLSGLLHGHVVYGCLVLALQRGTEHRGPVLGIAMLVGVKAGVEVLFPAVSPTWGLSLGGERVPEAHLVGAVAGLVVAVSQHVFARAHQHSCVRAKALQHPRWGLARHDLHR